MPYSQQVQTCAEAAMALIEALEWHEPLGVWVLKSDPAAVQALITLTILANRLREENDR